MRALIGYLVRIILCWILLFLIQQLCFLFFQPGDLAGIGSGALVTALRRALPMDLAAACYLTLPVALLGIVRLFTDRRWPVIATRVWLIAAVLLTCFVHVSDIGLFRSWGTKVNHKALSYLLYPDEALAAASGAHPGQLLVIMLAQALLMWFMLSRIDHGRSFRTRSLLHIVPAAVLVPGLMLLGMRGGVQDYPIDRSWSYHSVHPILNLSAMNGVWNVIVLLAEPPQIASNPYAYMSADDAADRFARLHQRSNSQRKRISDTERPNVVLVMLESWTADVVGVLGGDSGVTPGMDRLADDGLLYTNFYSTGFRTEQGLCALISAFPSQPKTTIIRQYGKFDRLPSLVNVLDSAGYRSAYWYAGDATFANTRSYLESMGFDVIHDEHSFPITRRTEWGAYDEELFAFHLRSAERAQEPFFHTIMTSTSHEPFDVPVDEGFPGNDDAQMYRNAVHYTDRTLAAFIGSCQHQPWYDRTLIFIVADHGHYLPHHRGNHTAERHRIPFLITGGALKPELRGQRVATYGCHVDFAATLLGQLGLPADRFEWSNDLLAPGAPHFAFWTFDDGFGYADSSQTVVWDNLGKRVLQLRDSASTATSAQEALANGQALEQVLLDRYIELSQ
ncbi:MAG: sulfatase-like hydrolase/transferase [Flavobacteriales bacterium]|nr:sulfatase-like hydrolase/transferase [Flavobacteriales bacterium]